MGAWIQSKTDRREWFSYSHKKSAADTTSAIQQTVQPTGVGISTVYIIRSEAKYVGGLFTFNSRSFIPNVDAKISNRTKRKMIKYLNKIYDTNKRKKHCLKHKENKTSKNSQNFQNINVIGIRARTIRYINGSP